MSSDLSHEYARGIWTIRESDGRFFVAASGSKKWSKGHKTLCHACMSIARRMEADYVERKNRRLAFNKKYAVKRRAA